MAINLRVDVYLIGRDRPQSRGGKSTGRVRGKAGPRILGVDRNRVSWGNKFEFRETNRTLSQSRQRRVCRAVGIGMLAAVKILRALPSARLLT